MVIRLLFLVLLALAACGQPDPPAGQAEVPPGDDRPVVVLLGATPTVGVASALVRLFDGDSLTYWATPAGSGPGESIRLTFADTGHPLREIRYESIPPGADTLLPAIRLSVFADGVPLGILRPGRALRWDRPFRSLLIRIDEVVGAEETTRQLEEGTLTTRRLPATVAIGLGELRFYDGEGREHRLLPPRVVTGELWPSSNLSPVVAFHAGLLFDGRLDRVWMEGQEGAGAGERILFCLQDTVRISELVIWNGHQASVETYPDHPRARLLAFGHPDSVRVRIPLTDQRPPQFFSLQPWLEGDTFLLEILEVYPGDAYRDLAISELCFREGERALTIHSSWSGRAREEYRYQVQETPVADWLDRRIFNVIASETGDFYRRQSLLFRSDGTFSAYTEDWSAADNQSFDTVTEGHWRLVLGDAETATLRLEAERTNFTLLRDDSTAAIQSFTDELVWNKAEVRGERYLDLYYLY